jgi:predicted PurR-regulated permease PerM
MPLGIEERIEAARRRRRVAILLTFLAIIVLLIIAFRAVLMPFLVAIFAAYLIDPVINRMSRLRIARRFYLGRGASVLILYVVFLVLVYLGSDFTIPALKQQISQVREDLPRFQAFIEARAQEVVQRWRKFTGERSEGAPLPAPKPADGSAQAPAAAPAPAVERPRVRLRFRGGGAIEGRVVARKPDAIVLDVGDRFATVETRHVDVEEVLQPLRVRTAGGEVLEGEVVAAHGNTIVLLSGGELRTLRESDIAERTPLGAYVDLAGADVKRIIAQGFDEFVRNLDAVLLLALNVVRWLVGAVYKVFLIMMITAFIVIDRERIVRFLQSVPPEAHQSVGRRLSRYIDRGLAGVIRGQLLICTVNGILTWIGLEIFDVRYALVLGFFAGVMSLIPIFGTILSSIPIVLVASTGGWQPALATLAWILLIHFVEANVLNPKIMGEASKIHPVVILFALLAGEHTYGIVGALLAVPTASIIQSLFKFYVIDKQAEVPDELPVTAT